MPSTKLAFATCCLSLLVGGVSVPAQADAVRRPPNVVLVFTDDQGYGDLSCYGHPSIHTPHLDALAAAGTKLTQFYVAAPLCSPSRAALLTGCYPKRVSMHRHVVFPQHDYGLHTDEVTIADLLKTKGYATGCFGKWHLGHRPGLLPLDQGFDTWAGLPYSNDMAQFHQRPGSKYAYRLPWIEDREVVEWEPDQHLLTRRTTEAAVRFVEAHRETPFFCYVPYSMPHIPIYASPEFAGRSPRGLYGDAIEEIDDGVGRIVATIERLGLREQTLIVFTSDNGPWLPYKEQGGSAGPLRGGKGTNWEGGQRVPCIVSWPGSVPSGAVCREVATTMDLLPTLAALAGADVVDLPKVDGHDLGPLLRGERGAVSPTKQFLYYTGNGALAGIRRGPWKLLFEQGLFQLEHDVGEQWDKAKDQPELVAELTALAQQLDAEITAHMRPVRTVESMLFDPQRQ